MKIKLHTTPLGITAYICLLFKLSIMIYKIILFHDQNLLDIFTMVLTIVGLFSLFLVISLDNKSIVDAKVSNIIVYGSKPVTKIQLIIIIIYLVLSSLTYFPLDLPKNNYMIDLAPCYLLVFFRRDVYLTENTICNCLNYIKYDKIATCQIKTSISPPNNYTYISLTTKKKYSSPIEIKFNDKEKQSIAYEYICSKINQ